ncbi:DsrE family protein [Candidatus Parabeggiatoa sp. HSG14]|uniref:DsrE family protein n=1 Tax=Candidatus Parabeggiatoa sp. HSG14 TaxID=3055593 RepID=UPI0025A6EBB7|nr:DsrE family protein [Thiotrichales bacterium HSG14]
MTARKFIILISFLFLALNIQAAKLDDRDALQGVKKGKVLFDINIADKPNKLALYLTVIQQTHSDLVRQNVEPDIVLAFRGMAVKLINTQRSDKMALEYEASLEDVASLIEDLQKKRGIKMEACGIAMRLFKMKKETLLPGIKAVGNTFVSIIGYHAQGYATIPIY